MLIDAKLLFEQDRLKSAANRAYYAMFDAASAILTKLDVQCRSHRGVLNQFGEHVIKKELLDDRFGKMLRRAYDLRQKSDYDFYAVITEEETEELVKNAEEFVNKMKGVIKG